MKTTPLKIDKRTFALAFNLNAMHRMEETIQDFDMSKLTDYAKKTGVMLDMILIMAREGELLEGRELDIDREWLCRHIAPSPKHFTKLYLTVMSALTAGLTMETEDDEEAEHDVVLEEIKKKETTGG